MRRMCTCTGSTKQFFQRGTSGFPSTCIISRRYKKMSGEGALICAECAHAQGAYEIIYQWVTSGFSSTCIISRRNKKMSGEGALICAECAHAQYAY